VRAPESLARWDGEPGGREWLARLPALAALLRDRRRLLGGDDARRLRRRLDVLAEVAGLDRERMLVGRRPRARVGRQGRSDGARDAPLAGPVARASSLTRGKAARNGPSFVRLGAEYDRAVEWRDRIRDRVEVEPSLYAADFRRLGEQIDALLAAGCRVFHFDCGDGHFVPPVTMGPVVLRSIAPGIHAAGAVLDCHLMVDDPVHHFEEFASSGADSVTFHVEVAADPASIAAEARSRGLAVGVVFNPETTPERAAEAAHAAEADLVLCMSIHPGYSGQAFMSETLGRIETLARLVDVPIQVDGGVGEENAAALREAGASLLVAGSAIFGDLDPADAYRRLRATVA
jgi:ribulose-phosphate 3-epimerase